MNTRLIENFKEITNLLNNRSEPVDVFLISEKLNMSVQQAKSLLNCFIAQNELLKEYNVIFSADILEGHKVKTLLIPSFSPKIKEVLQLKEGLLNFGVFAIYKTEQVNLLNDYSVFCHENKIIKEINVSQKIEVQKAKKNETIPITNITSSVKTSNPVNSVNIPVNNKTTTVKSNNSVSSTNSNLSKMFTNKVSVTKNETIAEKNDNNSVSFELLNELSNEANSRVSNTDQFGEENYYDGGVSTIDKIYATTTYQVHSDTGSGLKRKNVREDEAKPSKVKKDVSTINYNTISEVEIEEEKPKIDAQPNKHPVTTSLPQESIEMVDSTGRRKVRKVRKVKKTNNFIDEKGYMRTVDEWVDEEYWVEEAYSVKSKVESNKTSDFGKDKVVPKKPAKKKDPQQSLLSFMTK
jgi:hypothetical protein